MTDYFVRLPYPVTLCSGFSFGGRVFHSFSALSAYHVFIALLFVERCYVYNIFTTNHEWLVIIGLNLNLTLRLLFLT